MSEKTTTDDPNRPERSTVLAAQRDIAAVVQEALRAQEHLLEVQELLDSQETDDVLDAELSAVDQHLATAETEIAACRRRVSDPDGSTHSDDERSERDDIVRNTAAESERADTPQSADPSQVDDA